MTVDSPFLPLDFGKDTPPLLQEPIALMKIPGHHFRVTPFYCLQLGYLSALFNGIKYHGLILDPVGISSLIEAVNKLCAHNLMCVSVGHGPDISLTWELARYAHPWAPA